MSRLHVAPAVLFVSTLVAGVALFRWATGPLRSTFGDALVIVCMVAGLAAVRVGSARGRVVGVGVFSVFVECFQGLHLVPQDAPWWLLITVGSTFDPWDFLAYAAGLLVATLAEWAWR